jgi:acyl carrier protein
MPDPNEIRKAARDAVARMTGKQVRDDEPLISSGLIDSLSILKLIGHLETSLSVTIPPDNLQPDDFETVQEICQTVERVTQP